MTIKVFRVGHYKLDSATISDMRTPKKTGSCSRFFLPIKSETTILEMHKGK